jgi:hypothetical protein
VRYITSIIATQMAKIAEAKSSSKRRDLLEFWVGNAGGGGAGLSAD